MSREGAPRGALYGWRVAVTRPADSAADLAAALAAHGAEPVLLPLVQVVPPLDPAPLRAAVDAMDIYDWVVFTSANAVRSLSAALTAAGRRGRRLPAIRTAAVGPATAGAVADLLGWTVHASPAHFTGSRVAAAMAAVSPLRGARVLWPRAREAREALPRDLLAAGCLVDAPEAYRTERVPASAERIRTLAQAGLLQAITLTSPSAAECLAADPPLADVVIAVIGPSTAEAARAHGLPVHVEAGRHTIPDLAAALAHYAARRRS
jgi:uroporphyrinogen III methyltransferase / synthase